MSPRPERRPQPPTWPWVIGGAATVALLWYVFSGPAPRPEPEVVAEPAADTVQQPVAAPPPRAVPPSVARLLAMAHAQTPADSLRDKAYAVEALHRLADGLTEVAALQGVPAEEVERQADVIRQNADSVQVRTGDHANARRVNTAFTAASAALQTLRATAPPGVQLPPTPATDDDSDDVTTARPLSEQGDAVQRFLERAGATLRALATAPAAPPAP
jgi:hypothetical protein